jgi:hypothetical protein
MEYSIGLRGAGQWMFAAARKDRSGSIGDRRALDVAFSNTARSGREEDGRRAEGEGGVLGQLHGLVQNASGSVSKSSVLLGSALDRSAFFAVVGLASGVKNSGIAGQSSAGRGSKS